MKETFAEFFADAAGDPFVRCDEVLHDHVHELVSEDVLRERPDDVSWSLWKATRTAGTYRTTLRVLDELGDPSSEVVVFVRLR